MLARQPQAAVCIVRAELQPSGLLITVIVNRDVSADHPDPPQYFRDTEDAISAVTDFLATLTRQSE